MLRRFSDPFSHADARNRNDRTASVRYVPDPGAEDFAIGRHRNSDPFRTTRPGKRNARERKSVPESRSGSDVPPGIRLPNSQTHHTMSDRKHILIVSNACYPELSPRAFRTTELVRELVRRGHRVTLLLPNRETYRRNPLTGDGLQIVYSSSRLEPEKGTPTARRNRKIRSLLPKFAQRAVLYFYCHELRAKYDPRPMRAFVGTERSVRCGAVDLLSRSGPSGRVPRDAAQRGAAVGRDDRPSSAIRRSGATWRAPCFPPTSSI